MDWLRLGLFTSWLFRSAFAVVSFGLVFGSRSVLVLVGPRGGGFVCLNVGSRLVLVFFPSRFAFVCVRRRSFALVLVVLRLRWFRMFFSFVRCRVLVHPGQNWEICVVN